MGKRNHGELEVQPKKEYRGIPYCGGGTGGRSTKTSSDSSGGGRPSGIDRELDRFYRGCQRR